MASVTFTYKFRIIPITMAAAIVLFGVKLSDVATGTRQLQAAIATPQAIAAEEKGDAEGKESAKKDKKEGADSDKAEMADDSKKKRSGEGAEVTEAGAEVDAEEEKEKQKRDFTQIELDILQSLSKRREELDQREEAFAMKEKLLEATELRISEKLKEMKTLQAEVQTLLKQYSTEEDAKIRSLVKIYENMKPKDAAQIFNELEMPVLLLVIDQMSERKSAPILAQMTPLKAMEVTTELAELRKLQKLSGPLPDAASGRQ